MNTIKGITKKLRFITSVAAVIVLLVSATHIQAQSPPSPPDITNTAPPLTPEQLAALYAAWLASLSNNLVSVQEWLHDGYTLPDGTPADFQTIMDQSAADYAAALPNSWQQSSLDSALTWANAVGAPSQIPLADGTTAFLVSVDEGPLYTMPCNVEAAQTISTTNVWPGGSAGLSLTGTNRTLFMWDEGMPRLTHSEFTSRASMLDASVTNLSSHSTAVAGTLMAGGVNTIYSNGVPIGPAAKGMSFAGLVQGGSFLYDLPQMTAEAGTNNMRLSNHSYEHSTGWVYAGSGVWYWFGYSLLNTNKDSKFGNYSVYSASVDQIQQNALNYLGVWAAGNDVSNAPPVQPTNHYELGSSGYFVTNLVHSANGDAGGYVSVSDYGCAKNTLTIGAVYPIYGGYSGPNSVVWALFSSCGPTCDGRIKPEVGAAGVAIITTDSANDYAYQAISGTSFSTPNVAGSINLLAQYYRQLHPNAADGLASTLKGLVIHTADRTTTNLGPTYRLGYGLMNTAKASGLIGNDATSGFKNFIKEVMLNNGQSVQFPVVSAGGTGNPLWVTICWTDPAGAGNALTDADDPAIKLVNDLDLRLISPSGTTNFPWILNPDLTNKTATARSAAATTGDDSRNNVEQVYLANPSSGTYTVKVTHKGTLTNSQWVSILISGNVAQQPPALRINQILQVATNQMAVGWPAVVGGRYQVQYINGLSASNNWQNVGAQISARLTNVVATVPFSRTNTAQFFRVAQLP
jgi:Subtilase family